MRVILRSALLLLIVTGCGKKNKTTPENDDAKPTAATVPVKAEGPVEAEADKVPAQTERPKQPALAKAVATIKGTAIDAWLTPLPEASAQVRAKDLPPAVKTELRTLVQSLAADDKIKLRWVQALGKKAVAFSFRTVETFQPNRGFAVALKYAESDVWGIHSHAYGDMTANRPNEETPTETTDDYSFGKSRDIDGDGVNDIVITYSLSGEESGGAVLLGSRGGALRIRVWEGQKNSVVLTPLLMCWTTLNNRPVLLFASKKVGKRSTAVVNYEAIRVQDNGKISYDDVFLPIVAVADKATLESKSQARGSKAQGRVPKAMTSDAPDRGQAPLLIPFGDQYAELGASTETRPKGEWLLFHTPGTGKGLKNVARLGEKGETKLAADRDDERASRDMSGAKRVEFVTKDGVIIVGTLWNSSHEDQTTAILVHGIGGDRYEWRRLVTILLEKEPGNRPKARVLAIDLRGHGESTRTVAGGTLDKRDFQDLDWQNATLDVEAAIAYSESLKPLSDTALVGAKFGASLVAKVGGKGGFFRVGFLSPAAEEKGLAFLPWYKRVVENSKEAASGPQVFYSSSDENIPARFKDHVVDERMAGGTILLHSESVREDLRGLVVYED